MTIEEIYLAGLTREKDDRLTPVPISTEDEWWLWWQSAIVILGASTVRVAVIPSNFFKSSKVTRSNTLMAFIAVDREKVWVSTHFIH